MTVPFYLHWGEIRTEVTVSGADPSFGMIRAGIGEGGRTAETKSGVISPTLTSSTIKRLRGSGGTSAAKGSGGTCG